MAFSTARNCGLSPRCLAGWSCSHRTFDQSQVRRHTAIARRHLPVMAALAIRAIAVPTIRLAGIHKLRPVLPDNAKAGGDRWICSSPGDVRS